MSSDIILSVSAGISISHMNLHIRVYEVSTTNQVFEACIPCLKVSSKMFVVHSFLMICGQSLFMLATYKVIEASLWKK